MEILVLSDEENMALVLSDYVVLKTNRMDPFADKKKDLSYNK